MALWSHHDRHAFTLSELLLVLAISGTLAAIAIPRFAGAVSERRVNAAALRVRADLLLARSDARALSQTRRVTFSGSTYEIEGRDSSDRSGEKYIVDLAAPPYEVSVKTVDFDGDPFVVFDGFGNISAAGTVELSSGGATRTVQLDAGSGRASVK